MSKPNTNKIPSHHNQSFQFPLMADPVIPDQDINTLQSPGPTFVSTLQITVAVVILNFILLIVILILYVRAKLRTPRATRSRRLIFTPHDSSAPRRALDASVLNSLPITVFQSKDFKQEVETDGLIECAVCISELKDGEEVRFLPSCKHGFHVECIDMWFHSNDTCPLCRSFVTRFESCVEVSVKDFGTNLEEGSSSSNVALRKRKEGMLVIDIPKPSTSFGFSSSRHASLSSSKMPSDSPLPSSRLLEEMKTPGSGRMKSFKRLVGRVSFKEVASYYSSSHDIEHGFE